MSTSKMNTKLSVFEQIRKVATALKTEMGDDGEFPAASLKYAESMAEYLGVEWTEMLIFVGVFMANYGRPESSRRAGSFMRICEEIDVEPDCLLDHLSSFDILMERGYLLSELGETMNTDPLQGVYKVEPFVANCIFRNMPLYVEDKGEITDAYGFAKKVKQLFGEVYLEENAAYLLERKMTAMEARCKEMPFIQKLQRHISDFHDRAVFYLVCDTAVNTSPHSLNSILGVLHAKTSKRLAHWSSFERGENPLIKKELLEFNKQFNALSLGKAGKKLFLGEYSELYNAEKEELEEREYDYLEPEEIMDKTLFYNSREAQQVDELHLLFEEGRMDLLQEKLESSKLRKNMCVLFYGAPGTGKTETCLQLARRSGRKIMQVDIAATRTKWYGESENLLKKVFTDYKELCEEEELKPILLFNEADAFFSNRESRKEDTTHRLQNILLEEMENIDGILMATTNMPDTFDKAFERRFLFKIKFEAPEEEVRRAIWQSKLPGLADTEYALLAKRYRLSGAEIDNVLRKLLIREVIKGARPSIVEICAFCDSEKLAKDRLRIGFDKAC